MIREHRRAGRTETSVECVRECTAIVRMMMSLGWDDDTMCMEFGVSAAKLAQYKRVIISREQATLSHRPPEELYIEHRLMVMEDVHALSDIRDKATKGKQFAAATNAARARSQLLDSLFDRGQEVGVIPRAAKRHEVIGGLLVAQLTERELLAQVHETTKETARLVKLYGGSAPTKFIDLPPPSMDDVYRADPTTPAVIDIAPDPDPEPEPVPEAPPKRVKARR